MTLTPLQFKTLRILDRNHWRIILDANRRASLVDQHGKLQDRVPSQCFRSLVARGLIAGAGELYSITKAGRLAVEAAKRKEAVK